MPPLVMCIVQCLFIQDCASILSARHFDSIFLQNFKEFLSNFVMVVTDVTGFPSYFARVQGGWDWIYETVIGIKLIK